MCLLTHIFFLPFWLSQPSFWVEVQIDLRNDLTCWLRIKDGVFWVVPFENWPFDISRNVKTWGIVVILVVVKSCLVTLLLKVCLTTLKQMKLNCILMKRIQPNDWIENIFDIEKGDAHHNLMGDIRNHLLTFDLDLSTIHIDQLTTMRSYRYMRCERWWCNRSDSTCQSEMPEVPEDDWEGSVLLSTEMTHRRPFPRFLIRNRLTPRNSWCWVFDHCIHLLALLALNLTEQLQLIRIASKLDSESDTVVAELEVVGLEIFRVDLAVTFEQADLEGIDEYCKLPLSTENLNFLWAAEKILENSIHLAPCSANIDLRCVLTSHRLIFLCRSFLLFDLFGLDPKWHSADFDSMTKWSIDLCLWTWSCLFLLTYPSDSGSLRTLLILFLSFWFLTFAFALLEGINWSLSSLTDRADRWAWGLQALHCWSSWSDMHELETMM